MTRTGHHDIGHGEIDKPADTVYTRHFPDSPNFGDITIIDPSTLPKFDLITAGFPCQPFSSLGKMQGRKDPRGTLFDEIVRIAKFCRPRILLFENVLRLLSNDNGRTFHLTLTMLDEIGYDVEWQVLDSADFGCPQRRERIYIIGHLRGESRPKIFPLADTSGNVFDCGFKKHIQPLFKGHGDTYTIVLRDGCARTIMTSSSSSGLVYDADVDYENLDPTKVRRYTFLELERIMGFPDNWTKVDGLLPGQRHTMLGNAVTPPVIEWIGERL